MIKHPFLIQRLSPPVNFINPFSFGGGLKNGGLRPDAMNALKSIFSFDYMGSAEFEWGAIPRSLQQIARDHSEYLGFTLTCKTKEENIGDVYIICKSSDFQQFSKWIISKAFNEYDSKLITKEHVGLQGAINKKTTICGWLDIDNNIFFFTNKEMFDKTKKLFEVP